MTLAAAVAGAVSLLAWLYLLLLHGGFWRARQRLEPDLPAPARWPAVAAIVPARDEADVIGETLRALLAQRYPGRFRVLLVDDGSRDGTAAIARALATGADADRLAVIAGRPLPAGWTGKLWALQQGVDAAAAEADKPEWLLFTDADIRHGAHQLERLLRKAEAGRFDLVSLMARLRCETGWERLLIPAFVYFFQKLYPFAWIADPRRRTAGAAGGCVLLRRERLERLGGLAAIRGRLIDDCALARAAKQSGGRVWLGLADETVSLRAYAGLEAVWQMVGRSAYTQLRHSPLLLAGTVFGMALLYLAPPLLLLGYPLHGSAAAAVAGGTAWTLMAISYLPTLVYYGQPAWLAPLLPVAGLLYTAMTVDSARVYAKAGGNRWKGRDYAKGGERPHAG
jgi:hopene-associated glycosyltransferase HpnB